MTNFKLDRIISVSLLEEFFSIFIVLEFVFQLSGLGFDSIRPLMSKLKLASLQSKPVEEK